MRPRWGRQAREGAGRGAGGERGAQRRGGGGGAGLQMDGAGRREEWGRGRAQVWIVSVDGGRNERDYVRPVGGGGTAGVGEGGKEGSERREGAGRGTESGGGSHGWRRKAGGEGHHRRTQVGRGWQEWGGEGPRHSPQASGGREAHLTPGGGRAAEERRQQQRRRRRRRDDAGGRIAGRDRRLYAGRRQGGGEWRRAGGVAWERISPPQDGSGESGNGGS